MRPVAKRDSDIQWRILHGALASCRRLRQMGYRETDNCPFCNEPEDIKHIFISCNRLHVLSLQLMSILKCFNVSLLLTPRLWLFGCQGVTLASKHHSRVVNWIIITAKVAVWSTRINKLGDKPVTDALFYFRSRLIGRLNIEYRFHTLNDDITKFKTEWSHGTFFNITDGKIKLTY